MRGEADCEWDSIVGVYRGFELRREFWFGAAETEGCMVAGGARVGLLAP